MSIESIKKAQEKNELNQVYVFFTVMILPILLTVWLTKGKGSIGDIAVGVVVIVAGALILFIVRKINKTHPCTECGFDIFTIIQSCKTQTKLYCPRCGKCHS